MKNTVVLVDPLDNEIGLKEKNQAHIDGDLHRAVSVFILNKNKELLIQKRALSKYHSPGLWSNSCCTHPYHNETNKDAITRRVKEELGLNSSEARR